MSTQREPLKPEEVKAITDKVLNMASKATAVEVEFSGGERSATRFANSTITANMVQFDRQVSITAWQGNRSGTASTRSGTRTIRGGPATSIRVSVRL